MKKLIALSFLAVTIAVTANTGCSTSGGGTNPVSVLPDLANFAIQATTAFVKGAQALIHVSSSSLGNGTFTVNFTLSGNNNATGSATMTMSGGTGTFTTPMLTSDGPTTVTINSIANSSGGSAAPTGNNSSSLFDSTGSMVATYTPHGGTAVSFNATDVNASLAGTLLSIEGVVWQPNLLTINLYEDYYSSSTGTVAFNINDLTPGDPTSTFNGSAHYSAPGVADICAHGSITINTVSPLLTGSFTYTNPDSSVVAGTFSCPHP